MKKLKTADIIIIAALLISNAVTLLFFFKMPDTVPVHFGFDGAPDRWGSRYTVFLIGLVNAGISLAMHFGFAIEPNKRNFIRNIKIYDITRAAIAVFLGVIQLILVARSMEIDINLINCIMFLEGALIVIFGNYMPKVKQNYTFGVRTPWTLRDKRVWEKTNRGAGRMFLVSGLIMCVSAFTRVWQRYPIASFLIFTFGLLALTVVILIYSYIWFRRFNPDGVRSTEEKDEK